MNIMRTEIGHYVIDPGDAYSAGLALQGDAIEMRRSGTPRPEDDETVARGRRICADLADTYDRVAAELMRR